MRAIRFANEPSGDPGLPEVFQQDLSRMHPNQLAEHAKTLSPEQRSQVIRKLNSDVAASRMAPKSIPLGVPARPAYGPEAEQAQEAREDYRQSNQEKVKGEHQRMESEFSRHFNTAIGRANTQGGRRAIIGREAPRSFVGALRALLPRMYYSVAAKHGVNARYTPEQWNRDLSLVGNEMVNPKVKAYRLQHYDPHVSGPHRGKTFPEYFNMVATEIAKNHFNNYFNGRMRNRSISAANTMSPGHRILYELRMRRGVGLANTKYPPRRTAGK